MNKYLVATLFITLLLGNTFAASTCATASAGNDGNYNSKAHTTCKLTDGTGGYCATGYSDVAPSGGTNTAATSTGNYAGDCDYCAPSYIWGEAAHTSCVSTCATGHLANLAGSECGTVCLAGYSDKAPVSGTNTAATTGGTLTGNCQYCAPSYVYDSLAQDNCISTTYASGSAECATGYSDKAPASGTNTAATSSGTIAGDCKYCAPNYVYDSLAMDNCISTTYNVNTAKCATGYSDNAPASGANVAASTTTLAGDCKYCAPSYYFTSTANDECGQACKTGFQTADGQTGESTAITADCDTATPTSSGNFLTYSVVVILAILSLLF